MFNMLEKIARSEQPRTPVLDCRISKSLEPRSVSNEVSRSSEPRSVSNEVSRSSEPRSVKNEVSRSSI